MNKKTINHTYVIRIETGFFTGHDYRVTTLQVESFEDLIKVLNNYRTRCTKDKCEYNFLIEDCGGDEDENEITIDALNSFDYEKIN